MSDFRTASECEGGACVEVAGTFAKSVKCGDGACVEVAFAEPVRSSFCGDSACLEMGAPEEDDVVFIRNNTDPNLIVGFPKGAWRAFINEVRDGTTLIGSLDD